MSSELHFLPQELNVNDTQNNARKGSGGAHDIGAAGNQVGSLNWGLDRKESTFQRIGLIILICYLNTAEKFDSVLKRFFQTNPLEFTDLNKYSPL